MIGTMSGDDQVMTCMARVLASSTGSLARLASAGIPPPGQHPSPGHAQHPGMSPHLVTWSLGHLVTWSLGKPLPRSGCGPHAAPGYLVSTQLLVRLWKQHRISIGG